MTATMKKQITLIVFALFGSFALTVKSEAKVFIDPEKTAVDGSLEVKLTLRSKASNEPECRVVIDLGDGNLKRLRVGPGVGNQPLKVVDHQYEKAGTYEIRLRAPRQGADSKSSIPPCDVATKPLKLLVEAPKDKSEPQRPNNRKNPDEAAGGREKTVTENTRADKSESLPKELAAREESIKRREAELTQREQALKAELQKNQSDSEKKRQELAERETKFAETRPNQQDGRATQASNPAEVPKHKRNHSACDSQNTAKFYVLDGWKFFSGEVNATEVSIIARGKKVCFTGVATGRADGSNTTELQIEDGRVICEQRSDESRLAAAQLGRTGYKVVGDFAGVIGGGVVLRDCSIEKL